MEQDLFGNKPKKSKTKEKYPDLLDLVTKNKSAINKDRRKKFFKNKGRKT